MGTTNVKAGNIDFIIDAAFHFHFAIMEDMAGYAMGGSTTHFLMARKGNYLPNGSLSGHELLQFSQID